MKWLVRLATGLVVLLIIVAFLAPSLISRDMVRSRMIAQIEQITGRKLTIAGDIYVQFLPFPRVVASDVSLSGPAWQTKGEFISLQTLEVDVAFLPLLSKRVEIKKLNLAQAKINLLVSSDGQKNWDMQPKGKPAGKKQPAQAQKTSPLINFGKVEITDGSVVYRDELASRSYDLSGVNLLMDARDLTKPTTLTLSAVVQGQQTSLDVEIASLPQLYESFSSPLTLQLQNQHLKLSFDGAIDAFAFKGRLNATSPSLTALIEWLQPAEGAAQQGQAKTAPFAFDMTSDADCTLDSCIFKKLAFTLDKIQMTGEASYHLGGRKPQIDAKLTADTLDLSPLTAATQSESELMFAVVSSAQAAPASGWSDAPMDWSALDRFDATLDLKANQLAAGKLNVGRPHVRAKVQNGRLSADMIDAEIYSGKATVSVLLDGRANVLENRVEFAQVQAQPLLRDLMQEERLSGAMNGAANFITGGRSQHEMVQNLRGAGKFSLRDGMIRGINLADMVRNLQSAFTLTDAAPQKTDFAELSASFTVDRGVLRNNDLLMKAPLLRLTGAGQINLAQSTIDYRLRPEFVDTMQGQGGKEKQGIMVPVIVEGSLHNPSFRPDLAAAAQDALKDPQKIKDTVKAVKDQIKGDGLKNTVKDVKGLLKGF